MTDQEQEGYAREVWDEFTRRSGRPERIMSPLEWEALRSWLKAGVPLRVVLQAMSETKRGGATLGYYVPSVRAEYVRWRRALGVGA